MSAAFGLGRRLWAVVAGAGAAETSVSEPQEQDEQTPPVANHKDPFPVYCLDGLRARAPAGTITGEAPAPLPVRVSPFLPIPPSPPPTVAPATGPLSGPKKQKTEIEFRFAV